MSRIVAMPLPCLLTTQGLHTTQMSKLLCNFKDAIPADPL